MSKAQAATSPSASGGGAATNTAAQVIGAAGGGPLALASIGTLATGAAPAAVTAAPPGHSLQNSDPLLKQQNETTYYARLQEERTLRKELQTSIQTERRERRAAEQALAESQASESKAQAELASYKSQFASALAEAKRVQRLEIEAEMDAQKQSHLRTMAENEARQRRMAEGTAAEQRRALEDKIRESLAVKFAEQAAADREFLTRQVADRDQRLERLSAQCNDLLARNSTVTEALHRQLEHRRKLIDKLQDAIENGVRLKHMQTIFKYLIVAAWVRCRRMHVFLLRLHKKLFVHVADLHARNEALLASDHAASRSRIGFLNQSEMPLWLQRGKVWVRRINGQLRAPPIAHWTNVELAAALPASGPGSSPTSPALTASASTPTGSASGSHRSVPSLAGFQLDPRDLAEDDDEEAYIARSGLEEEDENAAAGRADSLQGSEQSTPVRGSMQQQTKRKPATQGDGAASSSTAAAASSSDTASAAAGSAASTSSAAPSTGLTSPSSSRVASHQSGLGLVHPSSRRHGSGVISVGESGAYKFSSGSAAAAQAQAVSHRKGANSMQMHGRQPSTLSGGRPKHSSQVSRSAVSAFAAGGGLFPAPPTDTAALAAAAFAARQKRMDPSQTKSAYAPDTDAFAAVVYPTLGSPSSIAAPPASHPLVRKWLPRLHEDELCSHLSDLPALLSAQARNSREREEFYKTNSESFFQRSGELSEQLRQVEAERTQLASALKFLKGRLDEIEGGSSGGGGGSGGKGSEGAQSAGSSPHASASQKTLGGGGGHGSNPAAAALQSKLAAQESSNTALRSALAIETHRAAVLQERVQILQASHLLLTSNRIPRTGRDFADDPAVAVVRMNAVERREWIERDEEARAITLARKQTRRATVTTTVTAAAASSPDSSESHDHATDEKVNSRGSPGVGALTLPPIAQHSGRSPSPPSAGRGGGSRSARDLRASPTGSRPTGSPTHRSLAAADHPLSPVSARASRSSLRRSGVGSFSSPNAGGSGGALKTLKSSPYKQLHSDASASKLSSGTPQKAPQPIPTIAAAITSPSLSSSPAVSLSSPPSTLKAVISTPRSRSKRHTLPSGVTNTASSPNGASASPSVAAAAAATAVSNGPASLIHEGQEEHAPTAATVPVQAVSHGASATAAAVSTPVPVPAQADPLDLASSEAAPLVAPAAETTH